MMMPALVAPSSRFSVGALSSWEAMGSTGTDFARPKSRILTTSFDVMKRFVGLMSR